MRLRWVLVLVMMTYASSCRSGFETQIDASSATADGNAPTDAVGGIDGTADAAGADAAGDATPPIDGPQCAAIYPIGLECNGADCTSGRCCYAFGEICTNRSACLDNMTPGVEFVDCDGPEDCGVGQLCCVTADEVQCQATCAPANTVCHEGCACPGGLTCGPPTPEHYSVCG